MFEKVAFESSFLIDHVWALNIVRKYTFLIWPKGHLIVFIKMFQN